MKLCLRCNQYFEDASANCPTDGSSLEPVGDHPLIGALINDRYVVDSVIGKGSSGIVYKATRLLMQREVAVKVLHSYLGAETGSLDRFLREARAASRLRHPHIINIWESGVTDDGQPYFVMDYLEGITIAQLLKDRGYLHPSRALLIIKQICEALTEAHNQSIVHRDVKPENIVLQESDYEKGEDFVKVLDFGIADQPAGSGGKAKQRTAAGSPAYMSPEQCQGFELDFRSDVYSLGVVVFEMLTGVRPFSAQEVMQLFHMHVKQPAPTLASVRPDLRFPEKLEAAVAKALSKKPEQRQQSIMEFGNDLEDACRGFDFGAVQTAADTANASKAYVPEESKNFTATGTGSHNFLEGPEFVASERLTADIRNSQSDSEFSGSAENPVAGSSSTIPTLPVQPGTAGDTPKSVPAAFSYSRSRSTSTFGGSSVVRNPMDAGESLLSGSESKSGLQPPARPSAPPPSPSGAPPPPPGRLGSQNQNSATNNATGPGAPSGNGQTASDKELDVERALKSAKRASESFKEHLASGDHAPFIANDETSLSPNVPLDMPEPQPVSPPAAKPVRSVTETLTEESYDAGEESLTPSPPKNDVSKWAQKVLGGAGKSSSSNVTPIGTGSSSSLDPVSSPDENEFENIEELKSRELERSKQIAEAANHLMDSYKTQPDIGTTSGSTAPFGDNEFSDAPKVFGDSEISAPRHDDMGSQKSSERDDSARFEKSLADDDDSNLHPHTPTNVEPPALNEFAAEVDKLIDQSIVSANHEIPNFETTSLERRRFEDPVHNSVEAENSFASEIDKKIDDAIIRTGEHSLSGNHASYSGNKGSNTKHEEPSQLIDDIVSSGNKFATAGEEVVTHDADVPAPSALSSDNASGIVEDDVLGDANLVEAPAFSASNFDPRRFEEPVHKSEEADNEFASEVEKRLDSAIMKPDSVRRMGDDTGLLTALGRNQVEQFAKDSAAAINRDASVKKSVEKKPYSLDDLNAIGGNKKTSKAGSDPSGIVSTSGPALAKKGAPDNGNSDSSAVANSEDLVMSKSSIDVPPSDIEEKSQHDLLSSREQELANLNMGSADVATARTASQEKDSSVPARPDSYQKSGFEFEKEDLNAPVPVDDASVDSQPIEDVEIVDIDALMESELDAQQAAFDAVLSSSGNSFGNSNIIEDAPSFESASAPSEFDIAPEVIPPNVFEEPPSSPFVSDVVAESETSFISDVVTEPETSVVSDVVAEPETSFVSEVMAEPETSFISDVVAEPETPFIEQSDEPPAGQEGSTEQAHPIEQPPSAVNERPSAADLARAFLARSGKGPKITEEPAAEVADAQEKTDEVNHDEDARAAEVARAEEEAKKAADEIAEQEARAAEELLASQTRAAEIKAAFEAEVKEEEDLRAAARQKAEEERAAEEKAAEERAEEERAAEERAAEERAAEEKAAEEKAVADQIRAAEIKASFEAEAKEQEELRAAAREKAVAEAKAADEAKAAEVKAKAAALEEAAKAKAKEETVKRYDQPISERPKGADSSTALPKPAAPFDLKAELAERLKASKATGSTEALPATAAMSESKLTEPTPDVADAEAAAKTQDKPGADAVSRLIEAAKRSEGKAQAGSLSTASSSSIARQPDALNKKIEAVKLRVEALKSGAVPLAATASTASSTSNVKLPGEATGSKVNASAVPDVNSVAGSRKRMLEAAQKAVETGTVNRMPAIKTPTGQPMASPPGESSTSMKAAKGLASIEANVLRSSNTNSKIPGAEGQNPADLAAQLVTQALKKKGQQIDPAGDPPSDYHSSNFRNVQDSVKSERAKASGSPKFDRASLSRTHAGGPNLMQMGMIAVGLIVVCGGGYYAYETFIAHPGAPQKEVVPSTMTVDQMIAGNKLEAAQAALDKVRKTSKVGPKDSERCIKLAKKLADTEKFDEAIEVLGYIRRGSPSYKTAQKLLKGYKVIKGSTSGQ